MAQRMASDMREQDEGGGHQDPDGLAALRGETRVAIRAHPVGDRELGGAWREAGAGEGAPGAGGRADLRKTAGGVVPLAREAGNGLAEFEALAVEITSWTWALRAKVITADSR